MIRAGLQSRLRGAARCLAPRTVALAVAATPLFTVHATAQSTSPSRPEIVHIARPGISGPRIGMSRLSARELDTLAVLGKDLGRDVAQLGWEFEQSWPARTFAPNARLTLLGGGLDRGEFLWTASALIGMRHRSGIGLAVGPQATPETVGVEALIEYALRIDDRALPLSLRYSGTANGPRLTFLLGFSIE